MNKNYPKIIPGRDLFNQVRGGFITQGISLNKWCRANGVHRQNAAQCLTGEWDGPKGRKLRKRLIEAAKVLNAA